MSTLFMSRDQEYFLQKNIGLVERKACNNLFFYKGF